MNTTTLEIQKILINLIRYGSYEPRSYAINPEKKVIYLNNSKAACTSIKVSLFNYDIKDDSTIHHIFMHKKLNIDKNDYPDYFIFTYVRNPFEKLVSCYKNKICKEKHYYDNYLDGFLLPDEGFEVFVNKILLIPDLLADRHFQSQYSLTHKHGRCIVDYIGKMESIENSYPKLVKKYHLSPLKHYNSTKKNNWMDYYNIPLAKKVYRRYKKDIQAFGYSDSYAELIHYLKVKN